MTPTLNNGDRAEYVGGQKWPSRACMVMHVPLWGRVAVITRDADGNPMWRYVKPENLRPVGGGGS